MPKFNPKDINIQLPLIDLTALNLSDSWVSNTHFIETANLGFNGLYPAAVCLYPKYVNLLSEKLRPEIKSCVVSAYFPSSQAPLDLKLMEIDYLNKTKVDEIDIVLPAGELITGNHQVVIDELKAIRAKTNKTLKVILETGLLKDEALIIRAGEIAIECGADFLKTSTGKYQIGATKEATIALAKLVHKAHGNTGKKIGLKIAGGVRTVESASEYIKIVYDILGDDWLTPEYFRIGASSLYNIIIESKESC